MRALFQIPARDPPVLEKKTKWTPEFHDFLAKCLEKDPKKRPSALELLEVRKQMSHSSSYIFVVN